MSFRHAALAGLLAVSLPAFASGPECPTEPDRSELRAFRDRVAAADSPEAAKSMALAETRRGHKAIARAAKLLPNNAEIAAAERRLSDFEAGVEAANTPGEVADRIDTLMVSSNVGTPCDYTGTEILIIVIGFLLGILPGILFLFLFC